MLIAAAALRRLADGLQAVADAILVASGWMVACAKPVLWASRACMDRAREWDPRLWERDQDPRSDNRERLP